MFTRIKYVKGLPYGYLVRNEWRKNGSRQVVVAYLGRVYEVEGVSEKSFSSVSADALLESVVLHEAPEGVVFDVSSCRLTLDGKEQVFLVNGGLLCSRTVQEVHKSLFVRNEERPGFALATALRNAGLRLNQQDFIRLYIHYAS
ncbi:MAG: hypothetical protein ACMXYD_04850 [Candidatus Woesearchaeota archaeon]